MKLHDSVNKGRARPASENKQQIQPDGFSIAGCVNERKQGSASQGLHCDTVDCSAINGLIEGNLQELGPHSYLQMVIPAWDTWKPAVHRRTRDSEAPRPNLTFS